MKEEDLRRIEGRLDAAGIYRPSILDVYDLRALIDEIRRLRTPVTETWEEAITSRAAA